MGTAHRQPPTGREGTESKPDQRMTFHPPRYAPSGKRRRYTDDERGLAMAMLTANGYPDVLGSLQHTANTTGIPDSTLMEWYSGNVWTDPEVRDKNKLQLKDLYREIAEKYAVRALDEDNIEKANARDAITVSAIAVDKMRLLEGLPTQIVSIIPDVIGALNALGQDAQQAFLKIIARAEETADYKRLGNG